tara:strand:- start:524 stop:1420 length:897 start_codon:yes stop_codon:yes gene_type:complete
MPEPIRRGFVAVVAMLVMQFMAAGPVQADDPVGTVLERSGATAESLGEGSRAVLSGNLEEATAPENVTTTVRMALLLTVVSLVPSVLAMTTCYVRFLVVLGLLRQALGVGQLLSNQVLAALCLFLTVSVMAPVWQQAWDEGVVPYTESTSEANRPSLQDVAITMVRPVREFMSRQIDTAGNTDAVFLLLDYQRPAVDSPRATEWVEPTTFAEVPLSVLLPSYLLSELKTAFTIGFLVFLPFVVIDLVVSSLLVSTGVMMLPPVMVSLPLKLLLFVMIDGWFLTVGMLLQSVQVPGVTG